MGNRRRVLLGLALCLALGTWAVSALDANAVGSAFARCAAPWLLLAAVLDLAAFALRAAKLRVLLGSPPGLSYPAALRITFAGALATDLLPVRADELVRAHLVGARTGLPRARVLGAIAVERAIDTAGLGFVFAVAFALAPLPEWLVHGALAIGAVGVALVLGCALARASLRLPSVLAEAQRGAREAGGRALGALWIGALEWTILSLMFAALLRAFDAAAAGPALAMLVASFAVFACPLTPGAVGVYPAAVASVLAWTGLDPATALSCAIAAHAVLLGTGGLAGAWSLAHEGLAVRDLAALAGASAGAAPSDRDRAHGYTEATPESACLVGETTT